MLRCVNASLRAVGQRQLLATCSLCTAARWCSTASSNSNQRRNFNNDNYNNNNNNMRRYSNSNNHRAPGPRVLPPAFDIVHWNDEDISRGHLLRVIHQDKHIVLDYHRQANKVRPDADGSTEGDVEEGQEASSSSSAPQQQQQTSRRGGRAERVVTVTLPPVYVARFLGVLEGRTASAEVQSRYTNATFTKKSTPSSSEGAGAAGEKRFVLSCVSRRPTSGQQLNAEGQDVTEETVEWTVEMDPAESLMLHRFLTQALQYNTGFGRRV